MIQANLVLNYSFTLTENFSQKITYVYLISSIILQHFKKYLELIIRYSRLYNSVPNWVQIVDFSVRNFLAKLTVTIVYLIYSFMLQLFKKILKEQTMGQKAA